MGEKVSFITVTLNPAFDETLDVPYFVAGQVNQVASRRIKPGGKGVNVARVLADLGETVAAIGFLGDQNPERFESFFHRKKITDRFIRIPGEIRTCIKIADDRTGKTTDVNAPGLTPSSEAVEELCQRVSALAEPGRWFLLCGSVPPSVDSGIYAKLIELIRARGGEVGLDVNGPALAEGLAQAVGFAKPNIAELREVAGRELEGPAQVVAAAREFVLAGGTRLAAVSMGAEGAVFMESGRAILARPPRVRASSTVGAGDAMVAGIAYGLHRKLPLEEIARLSTALGAHAVTGVEAAHERLLDYKLLLPEVKLEAVE